MQAGHAAGREPDLGQEGAKVVQLALEGRHLLRRLSHGVPARQAPNVSCLLGAMALRSEKGRCACGSIAHQGPAAEEPVCLSAVFWAGNLQAPAASATEPADRWLGLHGMSSSGLPGPSPDLANGCALANAHNTGPASAGRHHSALTMRMAVSHFAGVKLSLCTCR